MRRRLLLVLLAVVAVLAVLWVNAIWRSREESVLAREALGAGDTEMAVIHHTRAAQWYAPMNPFAAASLEALMDIGARTEQAGDTEMALQSYRSARAAIMSTRSFYTPQRHILSEANGRIAHLMAEQKLALVAGAGAGPQLQARYLSQLQRDNAPDVLWSLLAVSSLLGWVGCAFALAWWGFDGGGAPVPRYALPLGAVIICLLTLWILGMLKA